MTPTFLGRLQTRTCLLLTVGLLWTLIITPFLPAPAGMGLHDVYKLTLTALGIVLVVGIVWDCVYYLLQQFRWDKDWPTLFGLLNGINEAATTWWVLHLTDRLPGNPSIGFVPGSYGSDNVIFALFVIDFASTWIAVFLASQGPIKVFFIRWRFRGGQLV